MVRALHIHRRVELDKILYEDRLNLDEVNNNEYLENIKKEGFEIYEPGSNELILDIDTGMYGDYVENEASIRMLLEQHLGIYIEEVKDQEWMSKSASSKEGDSDSPRHIVRSMDKELPIMERLLLSLIFGSDFKKTLFDYIRVKTGVKKPHVLFKPLDSYWENKEKLDKEIEDLL